MRVRVQLRLKVAVQEKIQTRVKVQVRLKVAGQVKVLMRVKIQLRLMVAVQVKTLIQVKIVVRVKVLVQVKVHVKELARRLGLKKKPTKVRRKLESQTTRGKESVIMHETKLLWRTHYGGIKTVESQKKGFGYEFALYLMDENTRAEESRRLKTEHGAQRLEHEHGVLLTEHGVLLTEHAVQILEQEDPPIQSDIDVHYPPWCR
ncbi:hypothetical protein EV361DRAFT_872658 [Lentinula raphanica]|nr:hypothetical protein EV361DRAFT_872658 [Lentinula raphanica]